MANVTAILNAELPLTETLRLLGMTHEPVAGLRYRAGTKRILRDGAEVFVGTAGDVWRWLRGERL